MPVYTKPRGDDPIRELLVDAIHRFHGDLEEAEVFVGLLYAHPPEGSEADDDTPVLKLHGYACAALVRITPYRQRVQGMPDAVIEIDKGRWDKLDEAGQLALLDHELQHLELVRDDEGNIRADDCGRPKLKMRLHDVQLGVFDAIIRRHGKASLDAQMVAETAERYRQTVFAWGDDQVGGESAVPPGVEALEITGPDGQTVSFGPKAFDTIAKASRKLREQGAKA